MIPTNPEIVAQGAPPPSPKEGGGKGKQPRRPRSVYNIPGAKDFVAQHPLKDEIDQAILGRTLSARQLVAKYDLPGEWTVARRRAALISQAKMRARRNELAGLKGKQDREEKRVLGMLASAQDMAKQGFEKIMATSETPADIERGATYLDKYINSIRVWGEATGEIQSGGPAVQVDNRQLYVMSMPRTSDPPEVIEASERMLTGWTQPQPDLGEEEDA